jgi:hypothetical protein
MFVFMFALLAPTGWLYAVGPKAVSQQAFAMFYVPYGIVLTIILLAVCVKTGEPARWRWGGE